MKSRQAATAWLGLVVALTFAIAGCTDTTGSPTVNDTGTPGATTGSPTQGSAEAATALAQAAAKVSESSYKITTTFGTNSSVTGLMDPPNKVGQTKFSSTIQNTEVTIDSLMFSDDIYLKISGLPNNLSSKWLHIDVQRLSPDSQLGFTPGEFDPASTEKLLKSAANVQRVGDNGFVGTLDLTKVTGVATLGKTAISLGDEAKSVPFEATTDDQGRLVSMKINLPAAASSPARTIDTRYSDFGTPVTLQKPAATDVVEAPDFVYQLINR